MNEHDKTIETHKIFRTDDGEVSMKRFRVFKLSPVTDDFFRLFHAQWSGDYPSVTVSSPVVWPEDFEHPPSNLPFQSSLESSVVSLMLREQFGAYTARVIIPRAKLLSAQSDWTESSIRLFPLGRDVQGECAITGTRWINEKLEVFDFNEARVQRALASKCARGSGVSSSLPFFHTIPMNQHKNRYDNVLADDEHIVGIRYEVRCPVISDLLRKF